MPYPLILIKLQLLIFTYFAAIQVLMLTDHYLQYHSSTQIYEKREYAPFPDISVCNLQPNLDRVQSMEDYISRLDFLLALDNNQIDKEILRYDIKISVNSQFLQD